MELNALEVKSFKRMKSVEIVTPALSIVIGGNNSGKSSLLQGIHFATTVLQSAALSREAGKSAKSLGFDQFVYKPSGDLVRLGHGTPITSKLGPDFTFTYVDAGSNEPKKFHMGLRRGKNANISLTFDEKDSFFERVGDRTHPFSVFVPGLAGVPLREELRTPSIVANGIAQGDSNVYLRNVLYRILADPPKLQRFHEIIGTVFPGLTISSSFDQNIHLFIEMTVSVEGAEIPLELVGTGCLQAIQLVAYVTAYSPALLLLDEPDAHLHPSNQRLLAKTLQKISEDTNTKIILATHSRHMFDVLTDTEEAQVVWLKNGEKQPDESRTNLSVLLDLGALDSFELFQAGQKRLVLLTEDSKSAQLRALLAANGLAEVEYFVQPLHGVDNLTAAIPVADFFTRQGANTYVLIHRDGDGMLPAERNWWLEHEATKLPERSFVFLTPFTDVEHSFCQPSHISAVYAIPLDQAQAIVDQATVTRQGKLIVEFSNKRNALKYGPLKKMGEIPSAQDLIGAGIQFEQAKGKSLLKAVRFALQEAGHNPGNLTITPTAALISQELQTVINNLKAAAQIV